MVRLTQTRPFVHRAWERCLGAALALPLLCAWAQARAQEEGGPLGAARRQHARVESTHSRSMVISRFGIVASSQPLASRAGTQILEQGGNAIDAAIATNAVLGLVEPTSNGIGGDLFAMVYIAKTGKLYGLNASGWAPGKLTIDLLKAKGREKMPLRGIFAVTVPGADWKLTSCRTGFPESYSNVTSSNAT